MPFCSQYRGRRGQNEDITGNNKPQQKKTAKNAETGLYNKKKNIACKFFRERVDNSQEMLIFAAWNACMSRK